MKKIGVALILLLVISIIPFVISAVNDSENETASNNTLTNTSNSKTTSQQDPSKIELGFECLEEKVSEDCSSASTIQELALTILATPDNVFDACVEKLKDKESSSHFGTVKETALAILALNHAGEDTEDYESWLLKQNITPTDLAWYLEQDSNSATQCKISYNEGDYTINVDENKKIDSNAGTCLTKAQSNFWLKIAPSCFNQEFKISCNNDFIATLLYKNSNSQTIYVLDGTQSEPSFGSISLKVKSQCFPSAGGGNTCDYESTAWASIALLETGSNIEDFIPYVVAMSDSNQKYLPNALIYILTNYEDYASSLIEEQDLGNSWSAPSSVNSKYYDTALALIALSGSTAEKVIKARDWLLFSQSSNGCWADSIKDTAMVLWALEGRAGRAGTSSTTRCSEAGFFCIPRSECPSAQDVGNNYYCSSLSDTCCKTENLQSCSFYSGKECSSEEICTGNERKSSDVTSCCVGSCIPKPEKTECEELGYICKSSCSDNQELVSYDCNSGTSCCRTKTPSSSLWWLWVLIILILILAGVLGWIYRARLKLFWFKLKSRFKKQKGGTSSSSSPPAFPPRGLPPRPGFPPIRRPLPQTEQLRRTDKRDPAMSEVFKKLKEMSE